MNPVDPVTLRECTPEDAQTLAIIGAATLLEAFAGLIPGESLLAHCRKNHNPEAYLALFQHHQTRAWLSEIDRAPVGYAMLTAPDFPPALLHPGDLELRRIYLFSRFHGSGVAARMMHAAIASARDQGAERFLLGVHPENWKAHAFYRKHGFRQIGLRQFQVGGSLFEDPVFALDLT